MKRLMLRGALIGVALAAVASGQIAGRMATFVSTVDETKQSYALHTPREVLPGQAYPLIVSLHARGATPLVDLRRLLGLGLYHRTQLARQHAQLQHPDLFVVSPVARANMGFHGIAEQDIYDLIDDLRRRYPIDPDRVYLTGAGEGGAGALRLAATRPDVWAAVAVIAPEQSQIALERLKNLTNLPVAIYQGERDPIVPAAQSRALHTAMVKAGVSSEYVEFPRVRHNAWEPAFRGGKLLSWLMTHRRELSPARVQFSTAEYKYSKAYWLTFDQLTPGTLATADAAVTGNLLEVKTSNTNALSLQLDGFSSIRPGSIVNVSIDGVRLRSKGATASFVRAGNSWKPGRYATGGGEKQRGAEGPAWDAVSSRHVYVYGTLDQPDAAELHRRIQQAKEAAEWSTPRAPMPVNFRVLADSDAVDSELANTNLVLFGDGQTNSWIARYASKLPFELRPGAADYGLVILSHQDGRYVLINSGLSWWTRADQAQRPGLSGVPVPWEVLPTLGDYLLFKGGLDNVVSEGRFDTRWKLPPGRAAEMERTGAVILRDDHERHVPGRVPASRPRSNRLDRRSPGGTPK